MNRSIYLLQRFFACLVVAISCISCEEEPEQVSPSVTPGSHGVFILNQGGYNTNDAGISYYNFETQEFQDDILGWTLGATGQDILIYGSKVYISVSGSSNITVLDVNSHQLLKRVELFLPDGSARTPRYLEPYNGKIYASCYDGTVVRLDTTQLTVEASVSVGEFPEGMAVANGNLYVANSGGKSTNGPHHTVSVIDLASFKEEKERIHVGVNPYILKADGLGNIYLTYQGNFVDIPGGFQKIDTKDNSVHNVGNSPKQDFVIYNGFAYYYDVDYTLVSTGTIVYGKYDLKQGGTSSIIVNSDEIQNTPYAIGVNPTNGDIYIADSNWFSPGTVTIFNAQGEKTHTLSQVGMNPCKFAFY
jgi:YVTN family beta-propeller protein